MPVNDDAPTSVRLRRASTPAYPLPTGCRSTARRPCRRTASRRSRRTAAGRPYRSLHLEAHARAREHDSLAIGRPALVGVVATGGRQLLRAAAIGFHCPDRIAARSETREHDQIAAGRPEGEIVIAAGQVRHSVRLEIDDLETATAALSERSVDDARAVRRHRRKGVVVRPARDLAEACAVRIDQGDLCTALCTLIWFHEPRAEAVEERIEGADAEDDRVPARRPLRREHVARVVLENDVTL